jgi:hypothetical protein
VLAAVRQAYMDFTGSSGEDAEGAGRNATIRRWRLPSFLQQSRAPGQASR